MIAWQDILAAVSIMLVFEGIMPFLNPRRFRESLIGVSQMRDGTLRAIGLASMAAGVLLLYIVR